MARRYYICDGAFRRSDQLCGLYGMVSDSAAACLLQVGSIDPSYDEAMSSQSPQEWRPLCSAQMRRWMVAAVRRCLQHCMGVQVLYLMPSVQRIIQPMELV
jgi:hypothetical protein